jgi:hypothetical protein
MTNGTIIAYNLPAVNLFRLGFGYENALIVVIIDSNIPNVTVMCKGYCFLDY